MGLFSFLRKNKQQTDPDQGVYRSKADTGFGPGAEQGELPLRARKAKANKAGNQPNEAVDPVLPEKKRARRRLVGAVALVLAVVIVLPMILDSEPKPLPSDIAIQIPSRDKQDTGASAGSGASASAGAAASVSNSSGLDQQEEIVDPASNTPAAPTPTPPAAATSKPAVSDNAPVAAPTPAPKVVAMVPPEAAPKPEPKPEPKPKPEVKPEVKPKPKAEPTQVGDKQDDAARAQAILEGRAVATPAVDKKPGKFVLQVAALASQDKVDELQGKLKEAGIHSYTQKVPTQAGDRIRIRVGPFSSKEEAEKTRAKLAKLGLNGSVIPG